MMIKACVALYEYRVWHISKIAESKLAHLLCQYLHHGYDMEHYTPVGIFIGINRIMEHRNTSVHV